MAKKKTTKRGWEKGDLILASRLEEMCKQGEENEVRIACLRHGHDFRPKKWELQGNPRVVVRKCDYCGDVVKTKCTQTTMKAWDKVEKLVEELLK